MTALAATLACAVACLTLVGAEYRKARALRAASKALASLSFIAVGLAALAAHGATDVAATSRHLLAIGATLFFASDLAVARDRFVANELVNRVWGLPCYYAGQLLIAWSLATGASGPC